MLTHNYNIFKEELKTALTPPLPGSPAHDLLAPEHRKTLLLEGPDLSKAQLSSVMILFYPDNEGVPNLLFTKRVDYKGVHGGQMSFPGGKAEKSDIDLYDTALRETEEEIGLSRSDITILGVLSELYVPPSNFIIFPVVGSLNELPQLRPDSNEVARVISVPLTFFYEEGSVGTYEVKTFDETLFQVPGFMIENNLIWGATAMILSELILVARKTTFFSDLATKNRKNLS